MAATFRRRRRRARRLAELRGTVELPVMIDLFFQPCQGLDDAGEWRHFAEDHHPHGIVVLLYITVVRRAWS